MTPLITETIEGIRDLIEGMSIPNGYSLNWGDIDKEDWAIHNLSIYNAFAVVKWNGETNLNDTTGVSQSSYSNYQNFIINIRIPLTIEMNNPNYDIRPQLYKGLEDLKKVFANTPCLGVDAVQYNMYKGMRPNKDKILSGDRFSPYTMDCFLRVYYFQNRSNVFNIM